MVKRKKPQNGTEVQVPAKNSNTPPKADDLIDVPTAAHTKGRRPDPFLEASTQLCEDPSNLDTDSKPTMWYRCKGNMDDTRKRCPQVWAIPRMSRRIAEHVKDCRHTCVKLRKDAADRMAELAPGMKADQVKEREAVSAGKSGTTIEAMWKKRSDADFAKVADLATVKLICGLGLPPYIVDTKWWKEFLRDMTASQYSGVSGTTLTEAHITGEAARVRELTLSYLKSDAVRYVTIGFDGGATKRRHSFLTIHATDQTKRAHFLNAANTSGVSHTGSYYSELLFEVIY